MLMKNMIARGDQKDLIYLLTVDFGRVIPVEKMPRIRDSISVVL